MKRRYTNRCECSNCYKLLAVGTGDFEIKCPRCKTVSRFRSLTNQNAAEHPNLEKGQYGCRKHNRN